MTSQLTVGWWADRVANRVSASDNQLANSGVVVADGVANRVSASDNQSADSGVVGLMGWPTGQVQVLTHQPPLELVG